MGLLLLFTTERDNRCLRSSKSYKRMSIDSISRTRESPKYLPLTIDVAYLGLSLIPRNISTLFASHRLLVAVRLWSSLN